MVSVKLFSTILVLIALLKVATSTRLMTEETLLPNNELTIESTLPNYELTTEANLIPSTNIPAYSTDSIGLETTIESILTTFVSNIIEQNTDSQTSTLHITSQNPVYNTTSQSLISTNFTSVENSTSAVVLSTSSFSNAENDEDPGLSDGVIAAIVVSSVVGAGLIGALAFFVIKKCCNSNTIDPAEYEDEIEMA